MKGTVIQLGTSMILALLTFMASFSNCWPSYAIGMLKSDSSPIGYKISDGEANIISSIPFLAAILSTLFTGYVSEAFGRKRTQILCALIYMVAWSLIATAHSATQILVGRFVVGISSGIALVSVIVYISEITELSNRGSGTTVASLLYNMGVLASYVEGWCFSYEVICYSSVGATVVAVILMSCLKESPAWLVRNGREEEALKALKFYRAESQTTDAILEELTYLKSQANVVYEDVEKPMLDKNTSSKEKEIRDQTESRSPWIELGLTIELGTHLDLTSFVVEVNYQIIVALDYNRRALFTITMFMIFAISTGMVAVQTYANQFFAKAAPTMSPDLCSVLLAVLLILTCCATIVVTDFVSRRTLMISTSLISTICLSCLGASMRWSWVPVWVAPLVIVLFCIAYQLGVINIVFIQIAECFGPKVNSAATAIILCVVFVTNFTVTYTFGPSIAYFGIDGTFFMFAFIGAILTILSIFFLKETRRVPIEDVQKMYSKGYLCRRL